jgi:hypothetical protein
MMILAKSFSAASGVDVCIARPPACMDYNPAYRAMGSASPGNTMSLSKEGL